MHIHNGKKYYKLGLHIHTTVSDGHKTPSEVAMEYLADGYDAIALTDHNIYGAGGEISGLHIIPGAEYNIGNGDTITGEMHIVGLGMPRDPGVVRGMSRQQVVDAINAAGGIAVLAHPAWSVNTLDDARALTGVTATEIYNAVSEAHESFRAYSDGFVDAAANAEIYYKILATDDAHYYDGTDSRKGWICVAADEPSDFALIGAIRDGDFYATQGPELYVRREGEKIVVDCTPCNVIAVLSNKAWARSHVLRGENLTHYEYTPLPSERWLRIEVRDELGRRAWSNIFEFEIGDCETKTEKI